MKLIRAGILSVSFEILNSHSKSVNDKKLVALISKALSEGDSETKASLMESKILEILDRDFT